MKTKLITMLALITIASACFAGPELDRVLDYMFMDFSTSFKNKAQQFDNQREIQITTETSVGQTFTTGPDTGLIVRVRAYFPPTFEWTEGEGAELTLWDSPAKKTKLASHTNWYKDRTWHYHQAEWDLDVPAKPNTTYYFEIAYAGNGDGKIGRVGVMEGSDGCPNGQGYLNGQESDFDVCFQIHSRRAPDPKANIKRMYSRINLDHPGLEEVKAAVEKEDFETAIAKTVAYFESRTGDYAILRGIKPNPKPSEFIAQADSLMNATWRDVDFEGFEGKKIFGHAYLDTGDNKYAKKMNDLLIDWMAYSSPPSESNIDTCPWSNMWPSLSTGLRLSHGFVAYSYFGSSPAFTTDCRMAYIISLTDHCNTLVKIGEGTHGNWSFTQNSSMLTFSMNFPEFKESEKWKQTAIERLAATIKEDWLPDGVEMESAFSYQRMAYNPLAAVYENLIMRRGLKTPFADELRVLLEKQAEYFMYAPMPNGTTPMFGDWAHDNMRGALAADANMFNRQDMVYVSTAGEKGTKPKELSKLYPCAGVVTMRSDWGDTGKPFEQARYAMLHGVHFGAHGHEDLNSLVGLYAYGRELLTDPGSHEYASPQHNLLLSSVSHNLMTVNGESQNREAEIAFKNWSTTPIADYVSSYVNAYKSGAYTREVFFVRSNDNPGANDYWIVRDTIDGKGIKSLEQRWHFMLDSNISVDQSTLQTQTGYPDKGNLAILQVTPKRLKVEKTTIDCWQDLPDTKVPPLKMPTVIYKDETALPAAVDTVLFPFEGTQMPAVNLKSLEKSPNGLNSAFKVTQGKVEDLFILQRRPGKKWLASEKVGFLGERVFIRRIGGKLKSALLVNGSVLTVDGKRIIESAKPVPWVAVSFDASGTKVYAGSKEPSLTVLGAKGITIMDTENLLRPMQAGEGKVLLTR